MGWFLTKVAISALVVAAVSEFAARTPRLGAMITALPLVTLLAVAWMLYEGRSPRVVVRYLEQTFWYVLPTLPFFLVVANVLRRGGGWGWALLLGVGSVLATFLVLHPLARRYGTPYW